MDVSEDQIAGGRVLMDAIVGLTGLPDTMRPKIYQELSQLVRDSGHDSESLTLEQLRSVLLRYLEQMPELLELETNQLSES